MFNINDTNRDSRILNKIQRQLLTELLTEFPDEILHGAEFGVAYGGGLQQICTIWKGKGFVLGYDTFTEHPKHLASNPNSAEATAMDGWYNQLGKEKLTSAYIHNQLVDAGHSNFNLIEGEINEPKCGTQESQYSEKKLFVFYKNAAHFSLYNHCDLSY